MVSNEWKLPLNLAIGFHLLIALAIIYLPNLLAPTPRLEEMYTVNLINISESLPAAAPPAPASPAQPAPPKPATAKPSAPAKPIVQDAPKKIVEKAIALEEPEIIEPTPVETPTPLEAVSIKPTKRKVKPELQPEPPPKQVEKDLSQQQRQKLAEMIRNEQKAAEVKQMVAEARQKVLEAERKAQEEARILAEEADLERRLAEATANRMRSAAAASRSTASSEATTGGPRTSDQPTALEKQYYAAVMARIQAFWSLPEFKKWDPSLKATVVITIEKDGRIAGSFFESGSGDVTFDRFATKALQDVGHLPPIPAAIRKDRLEIGLNFTPGGIR
ncbi:energy transducer TonB [Desulfopila aestuarii]|uniref:TonB C terminal n=1 Tax=Desulfopila aestuarii DSM 18488 TaxID=1121416 RepID=A0A1M7Y1Z6_9BACT|nr:energy transducer TonB [Desulfopila aestuarii]SHO45893.1 TonB C terminal [Desulfopila aestuarii DSM 18488]